MWAAEAGRVKAGGAAWTGDRRLGRGSLGGVAWGLLVAVVGLGLLSVAAPQPAGDRPPAQPLVDGPGGAPADEAPGAAPGIPALGAEAQPRSAAPLRPSRPAPGPPGDRLDTAPAAMPEAPEAGPALASPTIPVGRPAAAAPETPVLPTPRALAPALPRGEADLRVATAPAVPAPPPPVAVVVPDAVVVVPTAEPAAEPAVTVPAAEAPRAAAAPTATDEGAAPVLAEAPAAPAAPEEPSAAPPAPDDEDRPGRGPAASEVALPPAAEANPPPLDAAAPPEPAAASAPARPTSAATGDAPPPASAEAPVDLAQADAPTALPDVAAPEPDPAAPEEPPEPAAGVPDPAERAPAEPEPAPPGPPDAVPVEPTPAEPADAPAEEAAAAAIVEMAGGDGLPGADAGVRLLGPEAEPAPGLPDAPADAEPAPPDADVPALVRFAAPFEPPASPRPLLAIVLLDEGGLPGAPDAVAALPFAVSVAIDPARPGAAEAMAAWRARGVEVVALARLAVGAQPVDAAVTMEATFATLPEAVALLDLGEGGLEGATAGQVLARLAEDGRGAILPGGGLGDGLRAAEAVGVPARALLRDLDGADQDDRVIRRFLDDAARRAGQEGGAILVARVRPETLSALASWGGSRRAGEVALAPVSAVLRAPGGSDG